MELMNAAPYVDGWASGEMSLTTNGADESGALSAQLGVCEDELSHGWRCGVM